MDSITTLLYRIKDNINAVEDGDTRAPLLEEIERDFLDFLELAKLFLISQRDSYYGYFFMNMQFRANFTVNSIAGIKLNEFPPVLESNPLLLCKFKLKEILYIICHEIDHVVLNHPAEMVKANPTKNSDTFYKFNLAADASVNDRINYEIQRENRKYLSAPEGLITSRVLEEKFKLKNVRSLENYAYYFGLINQKGEDENGQNGQEQMMGSMNEDGNNNGGSGSGDSDEQNNEQGKGKSKSDANDNTQDNGAGGQGQDSGAGKQDNIVTAKNYNRLDDHNWEVGDDAEEAQAATREFVNSAVDMMNQESRGLIPGSFFSQIEKINAPTKISWQSVLKKYVGTISANKRKTRMRLNRRQPERFDLSGTVDDKILKIVVAIDTSGSVSDKMIAQIFNEIFAILAKRKHEVTIIECDSAVTRVYTAKNASEVKMKVTGRGGTRFSPVIEYINKDKRYRDALLIYFTDGYGESEIPKPLTYRNIWVVFDNVRCLSVKEPYGIVLEL